MSAQTPRRRTRALLASILTLGAALAGLTVTSSPAQAACGSGTYGDGSGTSSNPYLISTAAHIEELKANGGDQSCDFLQQNDISFAGTTWNDGGIADFTGVYDGGGFEISGLTVTYLSASRFLGLFNVVNGGTIQNLGFTGSVIMPNYSGAEPGFTGGLVGSLSGTISNSYTTGAVQSAASSDKNIETGGLAGRVQGNSTIVTDSFSSASVDAKTLAGGLVGNAISSATIADSYAVGLVTVASGGVAGGLVAEDDGSATVTNSYFDATTTGQGTTSALGISKTTAEMQDVATFSSWNIVSGWISEASTTPWGICEGVNSGYPFLNVFYSSNPCSGGNSPGSEAAPPAEFQFTFRLPDGRECTSIGPVTVIDGSDYALPGADADCRTMPGATVGGWTIPVASGVRGAGSKFLPFGPGQVVEVSGSQQFTVVPFEPVIELVFDSNLGAGAVCSPNNVVHTDTDNRLRYVWVPRELVLLAHVPVQAACSPEGYVLAEWNTEPDGSGTAFNPGSEIPEIWGTASANTYRFYAIWHRA